MKESDKEFILELVKKETIALTLALETEISNNLKIEMNQFKIHLQFKINQKLMNITSFKESCKLNFLAISLSFKQLVKTIKLRLRYNLKL